MRFQTQQHYICNPKNWRGSDRSEGRISSQVGVVQLVTALHVKSEKARSKSRVEKNATPQ